MVRIEKKVWPAYFQAIIDGDKTFEVRLADWECTVGDTLVLQEWDPEQAAYTGRALERTVTYVVKTKEMGVFFSPEEIAEHGFQILGFR